MLQQVAHTVTTVLENAKVKAGENTKNAVFSAVIV
jgi:hypothetical protein